MSDTEPERVIVRSYRLVTDRLERRLFKIDRYRLPLPYGIPLRSILYAAVTLVVVAVAIRLPLIGSLLGLLPASVRWLALPIAAGIVFTRFEVDGRPPHRAALGWIRYRARPRVLSGLRRAPAPGARHAPVIEIAARPGGGEPGYVAGRVSGPAQVVVGYPCELVPERIRWRERGVEGAERLAAARRLRVRALAGARPLVVGHQIEVPAGRELVIDGEEDSQ